MGSDGLCDRLAQNTILRTTSPKLVTMPVDSRSRWPLMKNLGGATFEPGTAMSAFDLDANPECSLDECVRWKQTPFDYSEVFVPLDGRAPEHTFGWPSLLASTIGDRNGVLGAGPCLRQIPTVGAAGKSYGSILSHRANDGTPPTDGFLGA